MTSGAATGAATGVAVATSDILVFRGDFFFEEFARARQACEISFGSCREALSAGTKGMGFDSGVCQDWGAPSDLRSCSAVDISRHEMMSDDIPNLELYFFFSWKDITV